MLGGSRVASRGALLVAASSALLLSAAAHAQTLTWAVALGSGTPSAASSDLAYNTTNPTAFVVQGTRLYAFNATSTGNGAARWATPRTFPNNVMNFPSPVPLKNGTRAIFVAGVSGFLYALNYTDGTDLWAPLDLRRSTCFTGDQIIATPTVQLRAFANAAYQASPLVGNDDLILVITRYGCSTTTANRVYAIRASDSSIAWTFNATGTYAMSFGSEGCSLDYANNLIYCGTDQPAGGTQPTLWAISTLDGSLKWKKNANAVRSRPELRSGRLFVGEYNGILSARDASTGLEQWAYTVTTTANIVRNPWPEFRLGSGAVFVVDSSGLLTRVDEVLDGTGTPSPKLAWTRRLNGVNVSTLAAVDPYAGSVYVGASDSSVQQLDITSGITQSSAAFGSGSSLFDPAIDVEGTASTANRLFIASATQLGLFAVPSPPGMSSTSMAVQYRCRSDLDCDACAGQRCVLVNPYLYACQVTASPLPNGTACSDRLGTCSCDSSQLVGGQCPTSPTGNYDVCRNGVCTANNFAACLCTNAGDKACSSGQSCCGTGNGGCVVETSNLWNCGGCGIQCPGSSSYCSNGDCVSGCSAACPAGSVCTGTNSCCTQQCAGKTCGPDGCGGLCGVCAAGQVCTSSGTCCTQQCAGKGCGPDGCGGVCGFCSGSQRNCNTNGQCVCDSASCNPGSTCLSSTGKCCIPSCTGKVCGSDGCGGSCGSCAGGQECTPSGACCTPTGCTAGTCGTDDGCGNPCGCPTGQVCNGTTCCTPSCNGCATSGQPDGCGGTCPTVTCRAGTFCCNLYGTCVNNVNLCM